MDIRGCCRSMEIGRQKVQQQEAHGATSSLSMQVPQDAWMHVLAFLPWQQWSQLAVSRQLQEVVVVSRRQLRLLSIDLGRTSDACKIIECFPNVHVLELTAHRNYNTETNRAACGARIAATIGLAALPNLSYLHIEFHERVGETTAELFSALVTGHGGKIKGLKLNTGGSNNISAFLASNPALEYLVIHNTSEIVCDDNTVAAISRMQSLQILDVGWDELDGAMV